MDAALTGALIGMGFMVCIVLTNACYERFQKKKNPSITNPLLVRSTSKQWKMKELIGSK